MGKHLGRYQVLFICASQKTAGIKLWKSYTLCVKLYKAAWRRFIYDSRENQRCGHFILQSKKHKRIFAS